MSDHERERKREIMASVSDREEKAKMRERDLKREREAFVNDRESERESKQVLTTQSERERERERTILLVRRKSNFFLVPNSVTRWLDYFIFIWQLTKMIMLLYIFSKYDPKLAKYQMNI